jgi:hypothetical protein
MVKRLKFQVRSFGSEAAEPGLSQLAGWVREHHGTKADLTTYLLEQSVLPQKNAAVDIPCPGGLFYRKRLIESIEGLESDSITGELSADVSRVAEDAVMLAGFGKGLWAAFPAPHMLGLSDRYYGDAEEQVHALCQEYRRLMRAMRDGGILGHVLIGDKVVEAELEDLHGRKTIFHILKPGLDELEVVVSFQKTIALPAGSIVRYRPVIEENPAYSLVLLDATESQIREAARYRDPDKIVVAGYCTKECSRYWKDLVKVPHGGLTL